MAEAVLRRRAGDENRDPNLRDVNVTVDGYGLDVLIPTIPKPVKADIKAGFKIQVLTEIKGRPTYEKMKTLVHEFIRKWFSVDAHFFRHF